VKQPYHLENTDDERKRLGRQDELLRPATQRLFQSAGVAPGARVLDCGSGAGDVAILVAEMVTSSGEVLGIDRDASQVAAANRRVADIALPHVRFATADLLDPPEGQFDAIVGRLVMMYSLDPEAVLRVLSDRLRPGGVMAFLEFDYAGASPESTFPPCRLVDQINRWTLAGFQALGFQERVGTRLPSLFQAAGLQPQPPYEVTGVAYHGRTAVEHYVAVMRSMTRVLVDHAIATEDEIDIDTLGERLSLEWGPPDPVCVISPYVGVWARKP
jgi:SAM-dependent methyltransferase